MEQALFAAGCFWGVQYYFDQVPGVLKTTVGYTGGHTKNPTYEQVITHTTGHAEAVLIDFDPKTVTYETLVKQFFYMHDPTQLNRQGPDVGDSYRSAIYVMSDSQRAMATRIRDRAGQEFGKPIVTEITAASKFYPAEDYHQKFAKKTGHGMCHLPYRDIV